MAFSGHSRITIHWNDKSRLAIPIVEYDSVKNKATQHYRKIWGWFSQKYPAQRQHINLPAMNFIPARKLFHQE